MAKPSVRPVRRVSLLQERDRDDRACESSAQQEQEVHIRHQRRPRVFPRANCHHGTSHRPCEAGDAVHGEILLLRCEPAPGRSFQERYVRVDDAGMILFPLRKERLDGRGADCASKVAEHVEQR